jgi:hypothetical protein
MPWRGGPVGATWFVFMTPLQGYLVLDGTVFPGRCPGLRYFAPLGLGVF